MDDTCVLLILVVSAYNAGWLNKLYSMHLYKYLIYYTYVQGVCQYDSVTVYEEINGFYKGIK